ncbi:NACHT domain-containing protein [Saccharothrix obliqua]|uniref:NACHT domain-containing protein n=1 Tax=Saccharothrix obliqua TaxID=2861747 RepID=UPI001C5F6F3A|nr:hypothetical protein [Saccharothrix obliqua]MBW4721504.1 hypothetical protein [Saccharothrix obliqua]
MTTLVLLPIAINVGTGGTAPGLLGDYQGWLWPAVAVLTALTVVLGAWERLRERDKPRLPGKWNHPANRAAALDRVEAWTRRRRAGSLVVRVQVELELSAEPDMIVRPVDWVDDVDKPGVDAYGSGQVAALFEDTRHELLILGAPGAGKSTLLLDLCLALLAGARDDPDRPVPAVVDLASWSVSGYRRRAEGREPAEFGNWVVHQVAKRYGIPAGNVWAWLKNQRIALLLDGLDEVLAEHRSRCVDEINALRAEFGVQVAVCCRIQDYDRLKNRLELYAAFRIEPLSRSRLLDYFDSVRPALDGVEAALDHNKALWDFVSTPLMLNIMALTYSRSLSTSTHGHRRLFDDYIVEMLVRRRTPDAPFTDQQVLRALRFLARLAGKSWSDVATRRRLGHRAGWLDFVRMDSIIATYTWFVPTLLIGMSASSAVVVGLRYGAWPAVAASGCLALLLWMSDPAIWAELPVGPRSAVRWRELVIGLGAGLAVGAPAWIAADWFEGLPSVMPPVLVYVLVVLVSLVFAGFNAVTIGMSTGKTSLPLMLLTGLVTLPVVAIIRDGMSPEMFGSIATGLVLGLAFVAVGVACGTPWPEIKVLHDIRPGTWWGLAVVAVMLLGGGTGLALAWIGGARFDGPPVLTPVTGLLIGMAPALLLATNTPPLDALADALAWLFVRPLAATELPWRRTALLRFAAERILLVQDGREYRFVHRLIRDHLAECDPVELDHRVSRRLADDLSSR